MSPTIDIEAKILREIPLTRTMQLKLVSLDAAGARWTAPLSPNSNHLNTVFGGSLYTASAVACYSLVLGFLAAEKFVTNDVVIAEGHIKYLKPAVAHFEVSAKAAAGKNFAQLTAALRRRGRGRIEIGAEIVSAGVLCSHFRGEYAVRLGKI